MVGVSHDQLEGPIEPDEVSPAASPWRFGLLAFVAVAAVLVAVFAFGRARDDQGGAAATTTSQPSLLDFDRVPTVPDGSPATNFTIELFDGSRFTLSDHIAADGRPVFLNLWASWCVPCRVEMPAIDAAATKHQNVLFLGVAVEDDPQAARRFAEEIAVTYPLASEESDFFVENYGYFGLPAIYLITGDGIVAAKVFGGLTEEAIDSLVAEFFTPTG